MCRAEGLEISFSSCIIYLASNCTVSIVCFAICCVVPNGQGKTATITTTHPAGRFGILQMDYAAGLVRSFQEKGDQKQAWVNAGFAVFNKEVFQYLGDGSEMLEQFNEGNIRLLAAHGYQVHAAANFENGSTVSDERLEQLQRSYKKAGIGVYHIPIPRKVWNLKALILSYIQIRQLGSRHYTLIHCHSPIGGVLARAAAGKYRKHGTKVIYTAHGFHFYKGGPWTGWLFLYPVEWLCSWVTDTLITINQEDYLLASRHFHAGKTVYVPGVGVDLARFYPAGEDHAVSRFRKSIGIDESFILLLSVGELNKNKNHAVLIQALAALREEKICCCIAGTGDRKSDLLRLARSLGVDSRVHLLGYRDDIAKLLREADLFALPSIREGLNVSLMEAMASGLPCICSDIRGCRELVVHGKGGYRLPSSSAGAWAAAVRQLCRNPDRRRRMGIFNLRRMERFSAQVVEKKMADVYGVKI